MKNLRKPEMKWPLKVAARDARWRQIAVQGQPLALNPKSVEAR
jgi:hypothetical protein